MSIQHTLSILNKTTALRHAQELVGEQPGSKFNLFQILKMEFDEVFTHSPFLAELLNPKGSHGMGTTFLKLFLNHLNISDFEVKNAQCFAEYYIGPIKEETGGRIDLMIVGTNGKIIIENKIYAPDQKNQLLRYYNYSQNSELYYLTLFGSDPGEDSTCNGKLSSDKYKCISYTNDILPWLEQCKKESAEYPVLRESIVQYMALIKQLTNQHFDSKMQNELLKTILASPDHLNSFMELQSPSLQASINKLMKEKLESDLRELAKELNLELNFYFKDQKKWQGFTFFGNKELDEMQIWMNIQFDQFPNGLKYGFSYKPDANHQPDRPEFSLEPLQKFFNSQNLGSKPSDWWPAWVYWTNYPTEEICRDIYFSKDFIAKVREKLLNMLKCVEEARPLVEVG